MGPWFNRRRGFRRDQERRAAGAEHGSVERYAEGPGHLERRELREIDRQEEIKTPKPQFPTPKASWELEVGSWEFAILVSEGPQDPLYLASGFGRIWNFTSL